MDTGISLKISNILKKYFNDSYFRDCEISNSPSKKVSLTSQFDLAKLSVTQLKESELTNVSDLIKSYSTDEISIFNLIKRFLKNLSNYFQFYQWPVGLDEIYLNLFQQLNFIFDLFEAITK